MKRSRAWFWEGRFKCQALLDEQALLSCMAYVDLNPVRAAMATTPETSDHTSIQARVRHWQDKIDNNNTASNTEEYQPENLHPYVGNLRQEIPKGIVFNFADYLQSVDWTARQIRNDKVGAIPPYTAPILERLSISSEHWVYLCTHFESQFKGLVGSAHSLKQKYKAFNRQRAPNLSSSAGVFT